MGQAGEGARNHCRLKKQINMPHENSPPSKTLYQKLVDSHTVRRLDEDNVLLFCDLHLMNEYTSPQAFAGLHEEGRKVAIPGQNVSVVSHIIPTDPSAIRVIHDPASALQASNLARNCAMHGIPLFDTNDALQGIEQLQVCVIECFVFFIFFHLKLIIEI